MATSLGSGRAAGRRRDALTVLEAVALAATVGLGTWLRLRQLTFQSFWWDEGGSVYWANQSIGAVTWAKNFALDPHPPLYYLLLHGWLALFGQGPKTTRLLSALFGILLVPMAYITGRILYGRLAALFGALLVAIGPALIFYSQEARMYSLMPLLGLTSLLLTIVLLASSTSSASDPRRMVVATWAGWGIVAALCLYCQYYLALPLLVEGLALFWAWTWPARGMPAVIPRGGSIAWARMAPLLVGGAVIVVYLPWLAILPIGRAAAPGSVLIPGASGVPTAVGPFLHTTWEALTVGFSSPLAWKDWLESWYALLAIVGLLCWRPTRARSVVGLTIVVPVLLAYAVHVVRPFFYPRYVISVEPLILLLDAAGAVVIGRGVAHLARGHRAGHWTNEWSAAVRSPTGVLADWSASAGALGTMTGPASSSTVEAQPDHPRLGGKRTPDLAAVVVSVVALFPCALAAWMTLVPQQSVARTAFSSSDYVPLMHALGRLGRPGDLVLVNFPWQAGYVDAYTGKRFSLRFVLDPARVPGIVQREMAARRGVWWYGYYPEARRREQWARSAMARVSGRDVDYWNGDSHLVHFGPGVSAHNLLAQRPASGSAEFGGVIALEGHTQRYLVSPTGPMLRLTVEWRAMRRPAIDYTFYVHVLDASGKLIAQHDSQPEEGQFPTSDWLGGTLVVEHIVVKFPPEATAVDVGWYDLTSGKRLLLPTGQDHLRLPLA